eukprot:541903-Heterocapsa_arctica.AAC.1
MQFTVPPGSIPLLRQLEGYEDFDGVTEVLSMIRRGLRPQRRTGSLEHGPHARAEGLRAHSYEDRHPGVHQAQERPARVDRIDA